MSMYIRQVKIKNFKGIKEGNVKFKKGINFLIGICGCGKSTIQKAIDFLLNPNIPWWQKQTLSALDFYEQNISQPIEIEALIACKEKSCTEQCSKFQLKIGEEQKICPFREYRVCFNYKEDKFLSIEDIEKNADYEIVIRTKMIAEFNKKNGETETSFKIVNEKGDEWSTFGRDKKEWIGHIFINNSDDKGPDFNIRPSSLLLKLLGDIDEWKYDLLIKFKDQLSDPIKDLNNRQETQELVHILSQEMRNLNLLQGDIQFSCQSTKSSDISRQVELSIKNSENMCLPFSCQSRGIQNFVSMLLSARIKSAPSVLLIEEPEHNLEPQMQRAAVKTLYALTSPFQAIVTTHSPYVVSTILDIDGVIKLHNRSGVLEGIDLSEVLCTDGKKTFSNIRKSNKPLMELYEGLFSRLVVVWEGDTESSYYYTLMSQSNNNYPAELLFGINGSGSNVLSIASWFKNAGYNVLAVLDGDANRAIKELQKTDIPFIALPKGKNLEHILADKLKKLSETELVRILLNSLGSDGTIYWKQIYAKSWPSLTAASNSQPLLLEKALEQIDSLKVPEDIVEVLSKNKKQNIYQELALQMSKGTCVPEISIKLLDQLKNSFLNNNELKQWQFNDAGDLAIVNANIE